MRFWLRLPTWHLNIRKQVVKTPKLHFLDSGLACYARLLSWRDVQRISAEG
jgi:predicted AAA+ superfamily ATPase